MEPELSAKMRDLKRKRSTRGCLAVELDNQRKFEEKVDQLPTEVRQYFDDTE